MIIAIDGPGGAGKSTVARALARRLQLSYLDTGAMYRAFALATLDAGADPADGEAVLRLGAARDLVIEPGGGDRLTVRLGDEDVTDRIRADGVSIAASIVASHPRVRDLLVTRQQAILATGDWVVDGRDITTRVCPNADVRVFLTAVPAERARRRHAELVARGDVADASEVAADMAERDRRDTTRTADPLRVAAGTTVIDTTGLSIDAVVDQLAALAEH